MRVRLVAVALVLLAAGAVRAGEPVRILTVGNSFAVNATTFLPDLAKSGGREIVVLNAYKGGCSLEEHARALEAAAVDPASPEARIYTQRLIHAEGDEAGDRFSLPEALRQEKWDFVTIQQSSKLSDQADSFEPYAGQVIDAIRQDAPQAEILVHETWAWRADEPRFAQGQGDTASAMYERLRAAYARLASTHGLRLLPVGDAFQAALATPRWAFVPGAAFDPAQAAALPDERGGLHKGWAWKPGPGGARVAKLDGHHANVAGQYLAAAVFYEEVFDADVRDASFCPPGLAAAAAADLRRIAHETVAAQIP